MDTQSPIQELIVAHKKNIHPSQVINQDSQNVTKTTPIMTPPVTPTVTAPAAHVSAPTATPVTSPNTEREILLLWFNGTGTPAEDMAALFTHINLPPSQMQSVSGLGTTENTTASQQTTSQSWLNPSSYWIFNSLLGVKDTVSGYSERNQTASVNAVFDTVGKIATSKSTNIELIIGGHSRGAAAGILGFLASLLEAINKDTSFKTSPLFQKVKKMQIIAVDPVPGPSGNDLMGATSIADLYKSIQTKFENDSLIDTTLYTARFDCRDGFKADGDWLSYLNTNYHFPTAASTNPNFKFFISGFRHSIMIYPNDGNLPKCLYGNANVTPIKLLENILNDIINNTHTATNTFNQLIALEKDTVQNLKAYPKGYPSLDKATSITGYSTVEAVQKVGEVVTGSNKSLVNVIAETSDLSSTTPVNNRYTFYFLNK